MLFNIDIVKKPAIIILSFICLSGCAGSSRFTSEETRTRETRIKKERTAGNETAVKREESKVKEETRENTPALKIFTGVASYYSDKYHGRQTANGEIYNMYDLTAAHADLPFNTVLRVTNLRNNKSVVVRINDRMPSYNGRAIDLSLKGAQELDMVTSGIAEVRIEVLEWGNK